MNWSEIKCRAFGHSWRGCRCSRCSEWRDAEHTWDNCKCIDCWVKKSLESTDHDWDVCVCRRCRLHRDGEHDLNGCTCRKCGKEIHSWHTSDIPHDACLRCRELSPWSCYGDSGGGLHWEDDPTQPGHGSK